MKALKKIYIALIMLFLYAPMLVMVVFSFNASNSTSVMSGFSLKWYVEMFRNATALTALRNTLVLAVTSALISIIIGTAAAVGIDEKTVAEKCRYDRYKRTYDESGNSYGCFDDAPFCICRQNSVVEQRFGLPHAFNSSRHV